MKTLTVDQIQKEFSAVLKKEFSVEEACEVRIDNTSGEIFFALGDICVQTKVREEELQLTMEDFSLRMILPSAAFLSSHVRCA